MRPSNIVKQKRMTDPIRKFASRANLFQLSFSRTNLPFRSSDHFEYAWRRGCIINESRPDEWMLKCWRKPVLILCEFGENYTRVKYRNIICESKFAFVFVITYKCFTSNVILRKLMDDKTSDTVIVASRKSNNASILFRREPHCRRFRQFIKDYLTSCKFGIKPCHHIFNW